MRLFWNKKECAEVMLQIIFLSMTSFFSHLIELLWKKLTLLIMSFFSLHGQTLISKNCILDHKFFLLDEFTDYYFNASKQYCIILLKMSGWTSWYGHLSRMDTFVLWTVSNVPTEFSYIFRFTWLGFRVHLISAVSVIKRLSLCEFTLWGRDLVSVVCIRKSPYYTIIIIRTLSNTDNRH